jgi:hypothetical protein
MEPCVQSVTMSGRCMVCGGRAEKMHRPLFHRGSFCPRCCPVCVLKPAVAAAAPAPRPVKPAVEGATQWKDGGWGPHPDDPWYRDERYDPRPRWVPRRPKWFK